MSGTVNNTLMKAIHQLNNRTSYEPLDLDLTGTLSKDIQRTFDAIRDRNHLSRKAHKFISPIDCRLAGFYLLPEVRKPGNRG